MREQKTHFYSEGLKLAASFYLPDNEESQTKKPFIIACSGFLGLKDIHPALFARALTSLGYPCFGFDYRGFGESEGSWHDVLIEEQIHDIVNAAVFVSSQPQFSNHKIILIGWGMGAGLILEAAKETLNLRGLICINGFYSAKRTQRELRGTKNWRIFHNWIRKEREREVQTGEIKNVDPFLIYPLDETTKKYVDDVLLKQQGFGGEVKFTFVHSLLRFCPEDRLAGLEVPILIAHGDSNDLHSPTEMESLYEKYPADKELYWISNAGHTEWMFDDNLLFKGLVNYIDGWVQRKKL